jgi:hypothetical protein
MREVLDPLELAETEAPVADLRLLIAPEPWASVFLHNLRDLFRPREPVPQHLQSTPAAFWPDVFVDRPLPWRRFMQSGACHVLALAVVLAGSRFLTLRPQATPLPAT